MGDREQRQRERQQELEADLNSASDLFGTVSIQDSAQTSSINNSTTSNQNPALPSHLLPLASAPAKLTTPADATKLQQALNEFLRPYSNSPQYASFVEKHAKAICEGLKPAEVKKVAMGLNALATPGGTASAKKAPAKPKLGAAPSKSGGKKYDYDDDYAGDFGDNPDDFM